MTLFDALGVWINESRASLIIGVVMLTLGTYLASSQDPPSTFFCSSQDRRLFIGFLQWTGLLLDAAIAVVAWRTLAWARTTKSRLRTLSVILLVSSLGAALAYWTSRLVFHASLAGYHFRGLDSLYFFDVVVDGLAFSAFLIATSLLATEGSPLSLVGTITFILGLPLAVQKTRLIGTWENVSPVVTYLALMCICFGFSSFIYASNMQSVAIVHRAFVVFLLVILTIAATIYTPIKALQIVDNHPLVKVIYNARIEADRWLRHATVSDSLPVAVQEYKERHNGREPPPKFDIWYDFAKNRRSEILDHFPQMENDLLPFWGIPPAKIREDTRRAAAEPDMAMLQIRGGKPQHNLPPGSPYKAVMDDLLDLVKGFAGHLPDMELTINLDERPRVLAPWDEVQRVTRTAYRKRVSKLLPRAAPNLGEMPEAQAAITDKLVAQKNFTSVRALREMTALTCPPGTKARAATHWDIRDFCTACAEPQSQGLYLANWPLSQDICHQSDLLRLHSFHMTSPELRPLQELVPVFSRAKTDSYSDILIPLRRISEPAEPTTETFDMKYKQLFWRGNVARLGSSHELVRGGHQERLVHALNNPTRSEKTRLLLPRKKNRWAFEELPTAELNTFLPIDVSFASYTACRSPNGGDCDAAANEFPKKPEVTEPLRNQYVMVVDTDNGPPREFLRTLRSNSVPFYASIFKEWYSERLRPWVDFVPIDLRLHALHGTLAYFTGIQDGKKNQDIRKLNGRELVMRGRPEDAEWIAEQGKRWAEKALRREDMEVYLFRLLLEWGRIVDDNRDESRFVLP
ncbi:glycosyltransferase family 90 protein [Thermothielavioides terrestris NRRL 8126]|uniref:Glycosyltransferase family 90 protein n=1 Tax=Thermothielavioides terrestris (strain ATCC 38088 / NRRL 8126) TaxID=578455 RepID=G2RER7_THETT|nr:glycosyltransferase family 90 protein [Thermothielavioides terrestris NRRL 8126]AEO70200.1 glycosyltransferase family 90 protein [Thermothielavioides terrestris NRRL 8126]